VAVVIFVFARAGRERESERARSRFDFREVLSGIDDRFAPQRQRHRTIDSWRLYYRAAALLNGDDARIPRRIRASRIGVNLWVFSSRRSRALDRDSVATDRVSRIRPRSVRPSIRVPSVRPSIRPSVAIAISVRPSIAVAIAISVLSIYLSIRRRPSIAVHPSIAVYPSRGQIHPSIGRRRPALSSGVARRRCR
jgi:hypothetical protein